MAISVDQLDPKQYIIVKGAKVNNLKGVDVAIPRNKFVVITGVSGSGKSSLAFDTLFAEGQRMYVESLSSYARQFLGRMEKPEVEYIRGVCPAIAVEQKVTTKNPRSTVGTTTEIYDYLKLLYARVGKTYSPVSGQEVSKSSVTDIVNFINSHEDGTRFLVLSPLQISEDRTLDDELKLLLQKGFSRVEINGELGFIEELIDKDEYKNVQANTTGYDVQILIDRNAVQKEDEDNQFRIADSVQTALFEGHGECLIEMINADRSTQRHLFTDRFEADGVKFEEPSVNLFSFNNPYGACKRCEGFGKVLGIDEDLVIPDKSLSIYEGAIAPWRTESMSKWLQPLIRNAHHFDFPIHRPYADLTEEQKEVLWTGNKHFKGIDAFFGHLESKTHKIQYRVMLSRYRGRTTCPDCKGTRLRKDASYVKIDGKSIIDLVLLPITEVSEFFDNIQLSKYEHQVADRLLAEVRNRLVYLIKVGLGYLTLNRLTSTLSGGEYQRIKLATSLGSALVGSMYILDEPSIGLHPRDTENLIAVLKELKRLGNTVIVVEHEEDVMRSADQIIDIGPDAGVYGGELIFQGTIDDMTDPEVSHTARYLHGIERIPVPAKRRKWNEYIEVLGAKENNLQNISVKFPLNTITCVTGVSGSGKSTLVKKCLQPALGKLLGSYNEETGKMEGLDGMTKSISHVEFVDQNPIGRSSRSNPVTYVKAYDAIRELFTSQPLAKQRGYKPAFFSFNVDGGRCEACSGEGTVKIEMQFMADIYLPCESCHGTRFKSEILDIKYKEKNIADILDLSIDEAMVFFEDKKKITDRLRPLQEVGLGYIRLGQSSNTLSGGEAQRVKLASFLVKGTLKEGERVLFIFDEPTTGLHFHDINKLMKSINALVDNGHSVIIIEHNMEVVKTADWVIDLGPEGGKNGGQVVFEGLPEDLAKQKDNHTARYLKPVL
ncbi:excinuclease ABC subunit UvrA [Limibacter armeniacum]|uniref:excinuclease ABC subunit UvrA n=1 Tax=Limibacter armeniacum TaxID=466084 RepID=UPI002FE60345